MTATEKATATTRLLADLKEMDEGPPAHCSAGPVKGDMFYWQATILGPNRSPYAGGSFKLDLRFPPNYPQKPPECVFKTKIYHVNIYDDGHICLDILARAWDPKFTVGQLLLAVSALLGRPNVDNPVDFKRADLFLTNRGEYSQTAQQWTKLYAK